VKPLTWADEHPVAATCIVAAVIFVGLRAWSLLDDKPVLLARADPEARATIYGQITGSAVSILGIALTVLAILIALPDRPVINDIRTSDTWPRLRGLLLTIALLGLVALVIGHVGAGVDNAKDGRESLQQVMLASVAAAVLALLVAGLTFWLVLKQAEEPDDPSRGRGQG
jgi:cytochrome c oxidase assembly factor CtaG